MELKKVDVGVWVKASEELPKVEGITVIISYGSARHPFVTVFFRKRFIASEVNDFGEKHYKEIFWLKPIEQVYVLTPDDLEKILDLSFTVGGAYHVQKYSGKDMMGLQNKKQFIQSITK